MTLHEIKKLSNWSIVGIGFGFLFTLANAIRYYLIWPDMDKAIVYSMIGIIIMGISYLYSILQQQGNTIKAIEDYLGDKE